MSVLFSPWGNQQFSASGTALASGHKIFTYAAGSSTPLATFTDSTGATPQSNPIILNSLGLPTNGQIWITSGLAYKFVWTDANDVPIDDVDDITGVTGAASVSQWVASGLTPTYISTTSFTLAGDQTSEFEVGRRLQFTTTGGTVYGTIFTSAYGALTTVTMTMDPGQVLDSGLSAVNFSILTADPLSVPATIARAGANADITSLSGVTTINGVPVGWAPKRQTILAAAAAPLVIGTGLAVNLAATAAPYRLSIPAGMGTYGAIDYPGNITVDAASFWSGLTANVVNYLFVDRNTTTGALTGVASVLPYIAQDADTAVSVVNGQHTYDYDTGIMYVGNGATASAVQRVAVGECLAGAATITTVTPYRKMRHYNSAEQTITAGTPVVLSHNLGVQPNQVTHVIRNKTTEGGYPVGYEIPFPAGNPSAGAVANTSISADRLVVRMIPGSAANSYLIVLAATGLTGTITNTNWRQLAYIGTRW